ncbi:hypothetical protein [Pseudoduganella albidiflava]|uniref:Uncharacterized protein n=1 Tax=Pseudoduganella albidiflava TaxID=321983 RepID=A0A411WWW3_9BURK|nr:hypothetical protein [Pseudoduganella albidiflava]QBI01118.1 hypothetical protein EYF70_09900 [Pseudoduganella albidiflava]GGY48285.1 hypothetical protein GCM10007387_33060 [Pseudoduganella albidiflava]
MNAWRQLLMQVVLRHRVQGRTWITWVLLGTMVLPLGAVLFGPVPRLVGATAAGALLSIAVVMWWGQYLQTAMRLNTPASACLVPGLHRRLLALTAVLWIAASVPPAVLFGAATGYFGYALLACAATLLFAALCCRYPWLGLVPSFAWLLARLPWYPAGALDAVLDAAEAAVTLAGLLALAALGALVLRVLFPRGGDAHYRFGTCIDRRAGKGKGGMTMASGSTLFRALDSFYHARLAAPGRPAARLLDALGGRAHWSRAVLILAILTGGALACRAYTGPETMRPFIPLLLVAMMLAVLSHVDGLLSAVKNSRAEQGILLLAPVAPPPRDLNRQLALALLGRFGIVLGAYLAGSCVVLLATTGAWRAWLCCTAVALAFTPLLLRDHARHPGWKSAQLSVGIVMLLMAPLSGLVEYGGIPAVVSIACSAALLAGTAIAMVLRWRGAMAAAPAFPAGRLAS